MLAGFTDLLSDAGGRGAAVGAFTAYNLETASAVLQAAEKRGVGVMLLVSEQAFRSPGGPALVAALTAVAERVRPPCCVQLDHAGDLELMSAALDAGVGALMADGSRLPFADNLALVQSACELAASHGAAVEAELGRIEGDEEIAGAVRRGALTDPSEATELVERTGASCLAVSIGNAHGRYSERPALDWPRLEAVVAAVPVALSLHGASGIPDEDLARAAMRGIRKVNINTELRERYFDVLAAETADLREGARLLALSQALASALEEVVAAKIAVLEAR